jgi:putative transposase
MTQPQSHLTIESMCRLAQVSRAGYYRYWQKSEPRVEESALRAQIQEIVLRHRRNYGYRKVTRELHDQGWAVNHKRVARIMAEDNLLCIRRRRFVLTTESKHGLRIYVNLAARMELTGSDLRRLLASRGLQGCG